MAMMHLPLFRGHQVFDRRTAVTLDRIFAAKHGIVNLDASFWQMSCYGSPVPKPRYITPGAMLRRISFHRRPYFSRSRPLDGSTQGIRKCSVPVSPAGHRQRDAKSWSGRPILPSRKSGRREPGWMRVPGAPLLSSAQPSGLCCHRASTASTAYGHARPARRAVEVPDMSEA